jgi:4-hydroxy-L-threonine phosphate dehydrogenase PdxA
MSPGEHADQHLLDHFVLADDDLVDLAHQGLAGLRNPADSLFVGLKENPAFDAYVAMYHDQSHIPIKTVAFDSIAGLIIGTPLVIATVGHGTAFEIPGKGRANPRPMMETIKLVARSCET